jgi:hypothetical protein
MATKTRTATPVAPTPETTTDLKTLQEQKRLLDAQIKAARLAQPKLSKLESLIERQNASLTRRTPAKIAARVQARVSLGQPLATAMDEVFATYRAAVEQLIARATDDATEAAYDEYARGSN